MTITRLTHTPAGFVSPDDIDFSNAQASGPAFPVSGDRVGGTIVRYSAGTDSAHSSPSNMRHSHNATAGSEGGSVMATLSSTYGKPSVELVPGDPSSRTSIETAVREGLVRRSAGGQYEDVFNDEGKQASLDTSAPKQDVPADLSAGAFDAEDDALWAADIDPLPQHAYDGATASVVAVVAHGMGTFEETARKLASSAAISPELALEYVKEGYAMHERTVARAVAPLGISGERLHQFYAAAKAQPSQFQDAIQRLVHGRDVGGFKALAVAFKVANPVDGAVFKAAGFETSVDRNTGDLMLKRPGGNWVKASDLK